MSFKNWIINEEKYKNNKIRQINKVIEDYEEKLSNKVYALSTIRDEHIFHIETKYNKKVQKILSNDSLDYDSKKVWIAKIESKKIDSIKAFTLKTKTRIDKISKRYKRKIANLKVSVEKSIKQVDESFLIFANQTEKFIREDEKNIEKKFLDLNQKFDKKISNLNKQLNKLKNKSNSWLKEFRLRKLTASLEKQNRQKIIFLNNFKTLPFRKRILKSRIQNILTLENKWKVIVKTENFFKNNKIILLVLLFSIVAGFINYRFFTWNNFVSTIIETNAYWGILAIGMTFVILTSGIDLSIGSMLGLVGFLSISLIAGGTPIWIAFLVGLIAGAFFGFIQGFLIGFGKLPAFIITLVGMLVFRGIVRLLAGGDPVTVDSKFLFGMSTGRVLGLPYHMWILIIVAVISWFLLKYTKLGRHIYATGSNPEAAKLSGIKTNYIITFVYLFMGLTVAISSTMYISSIQSIEPNAGIGFELNAIAAVVLGGTSLSGGKGTIWKTIVGWLVISILGNALVFMGFNSDWQIIFKGLVILITIIFDSEIKISNKIQKYIKRVFILR